MKICKQCNEEYKNLYKQTNGRTYTVQTDFCSKSCKTLFQRGSLTKESIEEEIINFIAGKNIYCSKQEILKGIKRSSKTLVKFQVNIVKIQEALGLTKPKSIFQERVYTELRRHFTNIKCEKTFEDLLSPRGFNLRLDFYIKELNLIVEADGAQHIDVDNQWYSEYNKECDTIKDIFAKENGINMVRIPYSRKITEVYIKQYISDFI